jgi:hypothetical protein
VRDVYARIHKNRIGSHMYRTLHSLVLLPLPAEVYVNTAVFCQVQNGGNVRAAHFDTFDPTKLAMTQ